MSCKGSLVFMFVLVLKGSDLVVVWQCYGSTMLIYVFNLSNLVILIQELFMQPKDHTKLRDFMVLNTSSQFFSCELLQRLASGNTLGWVIFGYFNEILDQSKTLGNRLRPQSQIDQFGMSLIFAPYVLPTSEYFHNNALVRRRTNAISGIIHVGACVIYVLIIRKILFVTIGDRCNVTF